MKKIALIFLLCVFSLSAPDSDDEDVDMEGDVPVLVPPAQFVYDSPPAAQQIPEPIAPPDVRARRRLNF